LGATFAFWLAIAITLLGFFCSGKCWSYSPGQDHITAISLDGNGTWYENYEPNSEIQDHDIFFHGIGRSMEHLQKADIIFLGTSRPIFALDWRGFEQFERDHQIAMFNMGFAGVSSGEFALRLIRKWRLHPKLWVIDLYATDKPMDLVGSFFSDMTQSPRAAFRTSSVEHVMSYGRLRAYSYVVTRNSRWRLKHSIGQLQTNSYRSAANGNWYLDHWPNRGRLDMPKMRPIVNQECPAPSTEISNAQRYVGELSGPVVLTQMPSIFSCDQRVRDLAAALSAPAFTVDATEFSTIDGGSHLDGISSRKYTTEFFAWFEAQPIFRRAFSEVVPRKNLDTANDD
jgi:hypothetical protein